MPLQTWSKVNKNGQTLEKQSMCAKQVHECFGGTKCDTTLVQGFEIDTFQSEHNIRASNHTGSDFPPNEKYSLLFKLWTSFSILILHFRSFDIIYSTRFQRGAFYQKPI